MTKKLPAWNKAIRKTFRNPMFAAIQTGVALGAELSKTKTAKKISNKLTDYAAQKTGLDAKQNKILGVSKKKRK